MLGIERGRKKREEKREDAAKLPVSEQSRRVEREIVKRASGKSGKIFDFEAENNVKCSHFSVQYYWRFTTIRWCLSSLHCSLLFTQSLCSTSPYTYKLIQLDAIRRRFCHSVYEVRSLPCMLMLLRRGVLAEGGRNGYFRKKVK